MEIRIRRISLKEALSKRELRARAFQCKVLESIKSKMHQEGKFRLFGNFGDGLKEGVVRIQRVVQMGKFEVTETCKQAPERRRGLLF